MADNDWLSEAIAYDYGDTSEVSQPTQDIYPEERMGGSVFDFGVEPTEPEWGFDVYERISKSAQESFGAIWGGVGAMADSLGMEGARDWAINRSNELFEKAGDHDIVSTQFTEISNPIDLAKFTAEKVIEYIPDLALMFAGGAGVGTAAGKMGITTVGKGAAKTLAKKSLNKNLKTIAKRTGKDIGSKEVQAAAYKTTLKELGTLAGMASFEGFQGTGQMYASDVALRGADEASAGAAAIAGVGQAAIAMVSPFNRALSNVAVKKGVRNVAEMTIGEAVEEVAQGGIENLHEAGIDPYLTVGEIFSDPATYMELAEAGFVGALVGGAYGGAGRVVFGREGDEDSNVVDPEDSGLVDESPTPSLTPQEQRAADFEQELIAYHEKLPVPGTYSTLPQPEGGVLTAEGIQVEGGVLPEIPQKTADELLAEYEADVPPATREVTKRHEEALTEAYEPTVPTTQREIETAQEDKAAAKFEEEAKKDTYDSWFNRFAPDTVRKKELTAEMKRKMDEVEEDTNNLPTNLVERKAAIAERKKKIEEVVTEVETAPTKEELERYAVAKQQQDVAEAMANIGGETAGVTTVEKGTELVTAKTPEAAKKVIEEFEGEEVATPTTEDPDLQLILDNDIDGLVKELQTYKNPEGAYTEIALKAKELVDEYPHLEGQILNVLKATYGPATKREGAADTGGYKWDVKEDVAETTNPATKETYRAIPVGEEGYILVDKDFTKLVPEVFKTSIKAREALETVVPIEEKVKATEAAKAKAAKKKVQAKKKTVKAVKGRVSKEKKEKILKPKKEKETPESVEAAKKEAKKAARLAKVDEQVKKRKKVEKKVEEVKEEGAPEPVKTVSVEQYEKEKAAEAEAITDKVEMVKRMEEFFGQVSKDLAAAEAANFKPTTLGEGFSKVVDYLSGNTAKVVKSIMEGGKGKFESVKMWDIASLPDETRTRIEKKMADRGYGKGDFTGGAAPMDDKGNWVVLYDSRNMNDKGVVSMMVHEGLHVVTINELASNKEFNDGITRLRKYTTNQLVKDPAVKKELSKIKTTEDFLKSPLVNHKDSTLFYGLISNEEFVTNANVEDDFRKYLKGLKARRSDSVLKNLWAEFKYLVGRIFGSDKKESMLLDEVFNLTEKGIKTVPTKFVQQNLAGQYVKTVKEVEKEVIEKTPEARMERDRKYSIDKSIKIDSVPTKFKEFIQSGTKIFTDIFATTSERLRDISPKILNAVRKFEFKIHRAVLHHTRSVSPFIDKLKKLSREDEFILTKALFNGDTAVRDKILKKYSMEKDFEKVQDVLDNLEGRMDKVGLLTEKVKNYFPRSPRDIDGLISHYQKNPDEYGFVKHEIDAAKDKAAKRGEELSTQGENEIITNLLMTGNYNNIPRPGASKSRNVGYVTRELVQYYHSLGDTLLHHIGSTNESIEAREMLGKSNRPVKMKKISAIVKQIETITDKKELTEEDKTKLDSLMEDYNVLYEDIKDLEKELDNSIADFINKEAKGKGSPEIAINLVRSRLKQKGTYGAVSTMRNIAYGFALGSPTSAITQIGDLTWSIFRNNPINTMKGAGKAIRGMIDKDYLARSDFDFAHSLQEMSGISSGKGLDTVLTWTGLKGMDIFAKETAMQSTLEKWKGDRKGFIKDHADIFGGKVEAGKVWADIKNGKKSEDVLFVLFNDLSNWQPISLSEMPKAYLTAGNGRVFYMLKTFAIKALNSIIREVKTDFKAGHPDKAARKLVGLVVALSLSGAAADELKDLLLGKTSEVKDNVVDNMFQLLMLNKYNLARGLKTDSFVTGMVHGLIPPVRFADDFVTDLYAAASTEKDFKFKSLKDVPFVGKVAWSHAEWGRAATLDNKRSDVYDTIRGTVTGKATSKEMRKAIQDFNKDARAYNVGKKGDDKIKPISSTNIKNLKRRERKKERS
jgi:hypothetical protein